MPRGGKRDGAGRKPQPEPPATPPDPTNHSGPVTATDRKFATELLEKVFAAADSNDPPDLKWWRDLFYAQDARLRFDVGKYWYDKRDGKAIQPVDVDASLTANWTWVNDVFPPRGTRSGTAKNR